jgi:hypothetical protein
VKDVHPGDTVVIRGATQKNGTVAASSISVGGAGAAFGSGGATGFGNSNGGATGFGGSTTKGGG